jgi:carotenoid cleavage dioxygenase
MAPVDEELSAANLPVTGRIPDDLRGVYLRSGPNPKFTPLGSYTYPLDGDTTRRSSRAQSPQQ